MYIKHCEANFLFRQAVYDVAGENIHTHDTIMYIFFSSNSEHLPYTVISLIVSPSGYILPYTAMTVPRNCCTLCIRVMHVHCGLEEDHTHSVRVFSTVRNKMFMWIRICPKLQSNAESD